MSIKTSKKSKLNRLEYINDYSAHIGNKTLCITTMIPFRDDRQSERRVARQLDDLTRPSLS